MFMVNKHKRRGGFTSPSFIVLLLLNFYIASAQDLSKYYTSIIQNNYVLYYIAPQKGFYHDKNIFIYDITYLSKSDSITLNFSFFNKNLLILDSISLCINDECVTSKLQKIFIEHNKNKWQYRYSSKFSFNFIYSFFTENNNKPKIILHSGSAPILLNINKNKWEKLSNLNNKIFSMIKANN